MAMNEEADAPAEEETPSESLSGEEVEAVAENGPAPPAWCMR